MDTRRIAVAAAILLLAGCRMDPNQMLVERELRLQEDEIYRLRGTVRDYQLVLDSCRQENAGLRRQLGLPDTGAPGSPAVGTPATGLGPEVVPTPQPTQPSPPNVSLPAENKSAGDAQLHGASWNGSPESSGPTLADPLAHSAAGGQVTSIANADSAQVAGIALLAAATGGYDTDGQLGDEGITVVVQPYDQQGRLLEAPAEVTVVLLDPAEVGEAARLARWDLPAELTSHAFCSIGNTRGMKLDLLWPGEPPKHELVHAFVRYTTRDGRSLKVDQRIRVNLVSREVAGWAPRREAPGAVAAQTDALGAPSTDSGFSAAPAAGTSVGGVSSAGSPDSPRLAQQPAGTTQGGYGTAGPSQGPTAHSGQPGSPGSPGLPSLPRPAWSPYRP